MQRKGSENDNWTILESKIDSLRGKWEPIAEGRLCCESRVNILESESPEIHSLSSQEYNTFNIVLDSGAADHVVNDSAIPGYKIEDSIGSKAGACFIAANGDRIPNRGQVNLEMKAGNIPLKSTFQVSKISKPLWSVGKLCDAGLKVEFGKAAAIVSHATTCRKICEFKRENGLYMGAMQLKTPGFTRQAANP